MVDRALPPHQVPALSSSPGYPSGLRRWVSVAGFAILLAAEAFAQWTPVPVIEGREAYLRERRRLGIVQSSGMEALQTVVGQRTLEIRGVTKGSIRSEGQAAQLLLTLPDGQSIHLTADTVPDWLESNEAVTRMIVRVYRPVESAQASYRLLAVTTDADVVAAEARAAEAARQAELRRQAEARRAPVPPPRAPRTVRNWDLAPHSAVPYYARFIQQRNRRLSVEEANRIAQGIVGFSIKYGVDARLIMAMVMVESGFNPNATSRAGAMGLGQLMPGTARGMGVSNAYDSIENLSGTVRLVRGHLHKYKRQTDDPFEALVLSLAAYNAGGGAVRRHGGVPPFRETRNYIQKVISAYRRFRGE